MALACRACGSGRLEEVLDLGLMPLAGDFRPAGETNVLHPLAVDLCVECGLLQVREQVPHSVIFSPRYSYASSSVPGLVRHFEAYAENVKLGPSEPRKRLLEIGCNDGVFLKPLARSGYEVTGIDACENIVELACGKGLEVHLGVFGEEYARRLKEQHGSFDVVTCSNVFAHNPDLLGFIEGVKILLASLRGEFWVEVHSAHKLHEGLQWDCFYHEHCFYWSIHSLRRCLESHGLYLQRYQFTPMHGGALRAAFSRQRPSILPEERDLTPDDWRDFRARSLRTRDVIRDAIAALPIRYAYGAAGRAVTLINWTGIASQLDYVVDGSPLRYGRVIPNTRTPIISEKDFAGRGDLNGWCFVTAHNYLGDIRKKVASWFPSQTQRFVTPLPHVAIQ